MQFPQKPTAPDSKIIEPSDQFRREVKKVFLGILLFFLVYLLLIVGAFILAAASTYLGYIIVVSVPRLITLMIGLALVIFGCLIVYFLLKFLFSSRKVDRSNMYEITREEEPQLFEFIDRVNEETQSPRPKRIYLSNEVNAYVFYDSSFWSMFFPIQKNLTIGLGLVNVVNLSEFKAILGHEFGHFSQKSMKLGSYVYNVNKVIYNMLYENDEFEENLRKMGESSGYFLITAFLTFGVVRAVQWILSKLYTFINRIYMGLSRQMEYHADAISAFVTGSNHLNTALQRIEIGGLCFQELLNNYANWGEDKVKPANLYDQHTLLMQYFAENHNYGFTRGLIEPNEKKFTSSFHTGIQYEDQWASHPSFQQRAAHLANIDLITEAIPDSAWILFQNPDHCQQFFTAKMYPKVRYKAAPEVLELNEFKNKYQKDTTRIHFPKAYQGLYNNDFPTKLDIEPLMQGNTRVKAFTEIFDQERIQILLERNTVYNDKATLAQITQSDSGIRSFDYQGKKYQIKEAPQVLTIIDQEIKLLEEHRQALHEEAILFFTSKAQEKGQLSEYKGRFRMLSKWLDQTEIDLQVYRELMVYLYNFPVLETLSVKSAIEVHENIKSHESQLKKRIEALLSNSDLVLQLDKEVKQSFQQYINEDKPYYQPSSWIPFNLEFLAENLQQFAVWVERVAQEKKKSFLEYQLSLYQAP